MKFGLLNKNIFEYYNKGIEFEGIHCVFGAMNSYYDAFETLYYSKSLISKLNEKIEMMITFGFGYMACHLFCSQVHLVNIKYPDRFNSIFIRLLELLNLENIDHEHTYSWFTPSSGSGIFIKISPFEEFDIAKKEYSNTEIIYESGSKDLFHAGNYRESLGSYGITNWNGLSAYRHRQMLKVENNVKWGYSYMGYNRLANKEESQESQKIFLEILSNFDRWIALRIERCSGWMNPRVSIPLCFFSNQKKNFSVYFRERGPTLMESLNELDNISIEKLLRVSVQCLAGLHLTIKKYAANLNVINYDYVKKSRLSKKVLGELGVDVTRLVSFALDNIRNSKSVIIHGDPKPANLIIPWTINGYSLSNFFTSSYAELYLRETFDYSTEVIQGLLLYDWSPNLDTQDIEPLPFLSYIRPRFIDFESLSFAPVEHDLVRLLDCVPGLVSGSQREMYINEYIKCLDEFNEIEIPRPRFCNYFSILVVNILDRIAKILTNKCSYNFGKRTYSLIDYANFLKEIKNSNIAFEYKSFIKHESEWDKLIEFLSKYA